MKEQEAQTKICPIVAIANLLPHVNRAFVLGNGYEFCLGSNCMFWQWDGTEYVYAYSDKQMETQGGVGKWEQDDRTLNRFRRPTCLPQEREGCCGLADRYRFVETQ